jgi:hypothetical protein
MITASLPISLTPVLQTPASEAAQSGAMFLATLSASVSTIVLQTRPTDAAVPEIGGSATPLPDPAADAFALAHSLDVAAIALPAPQAKAQIASLSKRVTTAPIQLKMTEVPAALSSDLIAVPSPAPIMPKRARFNTPVLETASVKLVPQICAALQEVLAADRTETDDSAKSNLVPMSNQNDDHRTPANQFSTVPGENALDATLTAEPELLTDQELAGPTTMMAAQSGQSDAPTPQAEQPKPLARPSSAQLAPAAKPHPQTGLKNAEQEGEKDELAPTPTVTADRTIPVVSPAFVQVPIPENAQPMAAVRYRSDSPAQVVATDSSLTPIAVTAEPSKPPLSLPPPLPVDGAMSASVAQAPGADQPRVLDDQIGAPTIPLAAMPPPTSPSFASDPIAQATAPRPAVAITVATNDTKAEHGTTDEPAVVQATAMLPATAALPVTPRSAPPDSARPELVELGVKTEVVKKESHKPEELPGSAISMPGRAPRVAVRPKWLWSPPASLTLCCPNPGLKTWSKS